MEISSKHQLFVFGIYILAGIGCGIFFDVQRSIRRVLSAGRIRTLLEDFLFALVCTVGAIVAGFLFNRGQMRYYQIMGLASGVLFYAAFLSLFTMKSLLFLYTILRKFVFRPFVLTAKIVLSPFLRIYLIFKKINRKMSMYFSKVVQHIKASKNKVKKRMKML